MTRDITDIRSDLAIQRDLVHRLRTAVFELQDDPAGDTQLLKQLGESEQRLEELELEEVESLEQTPADQPPEDLYLGAGTTGLEVTTQVLMDPLPTGIYHLLDIAKEPLLTVTVENSSQETRRLIVKSYLEALSAEAVRTVEIPPLDTCEPIHLLPTIFPERVQLMTQVRRATLHVIVEDLDSKKLEVHNTYQITCLARHSSFNSYENPETKQEINLMHYYGAWVTPHAPNVQERVRAAAELFPGGKIQGYQPDASVRDQVRALYDSLKESGITYINSRIDFGAADGQSTQRTRLPRESLQQKSANCIDGTVLMASLLEAATLHPAIVTVPGHAFVGYESANKSDDWEFIETTMIGSHDFDDAVASAEKTYKQMMQYVPNKVRIHKLRDLRQRGIWPLE